MSSLVRRLTGIRAALVAFAILVVVLAVPRSSAAETRHFAVIVGVGSGAGVGRGDLRFADDDAAKYAVLFRRAMPTAEVVLVSRFDADTTRLFPALGATARAPTRAVLAEVLTGVTEKARSLAAMGHSAELHFVFAGHGDVDGGRAFLQLEDGRLTGDELARRLRAFPGRSHLLLDACNSIFVVQARKPGGLRSTTPSEAAAALAEALPNTGVLLASGSDGEVYEWATLGSGIFSHVVRSGLAGGADANGDGMLSYRELRAFVTVATRSLANPKFRPEVFARGPGGNDDTPLLTVPPSSSIAIPVRARLTLEDSFGVPWADTNPEPGFLPRVLVPDRLSMLEEEGEAARSFSFVEHTRGGSTRYSATESVVRLEGTIAARGGDAVFGSLFAEPFGPNALAKVERERAPEPVYGVSSADMQRLDSLVREVAGTSRGVRLASGMAGLGTGVAITTLGAIRTAGTKTPQDRYFATFDISAGLLWMGIQGGVRLANPSAGEVLLRRHEGRLAMGANPRIAFSRTERELFDLAARERASRLQWAAWSFVFAGASLATMAIEVATIVPEKRITFGAPVLLLNLCLGSGFMNLFPSPIERLAEVWRRDPERARFGASLTITPVVFGAPGLGLGGSF